MGLAPIQCCNGALYVFTRDPRPEVLRHSILFQRCDYLIELVEELLIGIEITVRPFGLCSRSMSSAPSRPARSSRPYEVMSRPLQVYLMSCACVTCPEACRRRSRYHFRAGIPRNRRTPHASARQVLDFFVWVTAGESAGGRRRFVSDLAQLPAIRRGRHHAVDGHARRKLIMTSSRRPS